MFPAKTGIGKVKTTLWLATVFSAAGMALAAAPAQATCVGGCGIHAANGVVTASPLGGDYHYVTTFGGVDGVGSLGVGSETNGSVFTTGSFTAQAGDSLQFYFNYVTSDGSGFEDYGWAQLQDLAGAPVATLFTARTITSGNVVPGFGLPGLLATLNPATTPIIAGAPAWSLLGPTSTKTCWDAGCGYTGWIKSTYTVASAGSYRFAVGVTNLHDTIFDTGMAFAGITIAGTAVPDDDGDGSVGAVPEPAAWALLIAGFGMTGATMRRRRSRLLASGLHRDGISASLTV
jgi:hypothetical protein